METNASAPPPPSESGLGSEIQSTVAGSVIGSDEQPKKTAAAAPQTEPNQGSKAQPDKTASTAPRTEPIQESAARPDKTASAATRTDVVLGSELSALTIASFGAPPSESGVGSERQSHSSGHRSGPATSSAATSLRNPRSSVSIPMRLISECTGKIICVATVDGCVYKGTLSTYDELSMSTNLDMVSVTHADGKVTRHESIYIRGNNVRFVMMPEAMQDHPILDLFQKPDPAQPNMSGDRRDSDRGPPPRGAFGGDRRGSDRGPPPRGAFGGGSSSRFGDRSTGGDRRMNGGYGQHDRR